MGPSVGFPNHTLFGAYDIQTVLQDALRQLWSLAFPGTPCTALKTPQWKEMGWQVGPSACDLRLLVPCLP